MAEYTEAQVEEKVQEAVEKTERSFGGTFKRLKSENEELKATYEKVTAEHEKDREDMEKRIQELESVISQSKQQISELAVRSEFQKQLREAGPLPERFVDVASIEYSDDPEVLKTKVSEAVEKGRKEFEQTLSEHGIALPNNTIRVSNPTNPPSRDTITGHNIRNAEARETLHDMIRRGLIR
ncbi:MAG: hypothetical protein JXB48_11980 [Candidatus Latescibacteria bacterium]|nr:hypothetical protein [Candidatus Latescibacterota bacterium]